MMLKRLTLLVACAAALGLGAAEIPWRVPEYSLTARSLKVRELLETFAVAEGVPIVLSEAVRGEMSGDFAKVPAREFLDRVATVNNLTWYYDGATVWVYGSGEILTTLLDLRYMKADEVLALMRDLGVEDARFPLKSASGGELVMVSGPPRYVTLVVDMIAKADRLREQRTFTQVETRLFPLTYTWADSVSFQRTSGTGLETSTSIRGVASLLQEIMQVGNGKVQEGTNEIDRAAGTLPTPVIRPENRLNAVLVRDAAPRMPMYESLIRELDRPQKLVEIGVTVLELSREDALDWQLSLSVSGSHARHSAAVGQNVDNLLTPETLSGLGAAGAYSYIGKKVDVNASVLALKSKGKALNVSRTSLLTLNNMTAELSDTASYSAKLVGEKVASVSETSAGTRLAVKPRIVEPPAGATNAVRQVWLTLELEDGGLDMLTTVDSLPTKRSTSLETQASLPEGESLLLAGYFKDVDEESGWGIPYLRDIPWIGWIFGGHSTKKETVQRLFILTPHVIDPFADYSSPTQGVATVQLLRQRDMTEPERMSDEADRDDKVRKEREAQLEEKRTIRHEQFSETYRRNEKERGLRKERRDAANEESRKAWDLDFESRFEAFRKEQEAKEAAEKAKR